MISFVLYHRAWLDAYFATWWCSLRRYESFEWMCQTLENLTLRLDLPWLFFFALMIIFFRLKDASAINTIPFVSEYNHNSVQHFQHQRRSSKFSVKVWRLQFGYFQLKLHSLALLLLNRVNNIAFGFGAKL